MDKEIFRHFVYVFVNCELNMLYNKDCYHDGIHFLIDDF